MKQQPQQKQTNWVLFNVKHLSQHAVQYRRPCRLELFETLLVGNYVQLMFRSSNNRPRFVGIEKIWCEIIGFHEGLYTAKVVEVPRVIAELNHGDSVFFSFDYVLGCCTKERMQERLKKVDVSSSLTNSMN